MDNRTITSAVGVGDFKKVDRTLIRLERIDGENVCASVTGENQDEVFEMLGDCLAEQLYDHPEYRKVMKKMFRQKFAPATRPARPKNTYRDAPTASPTRSVSEEMTRRVML